MHNSCTDEKQGTLLAAYELGILDSDEKAGFETHLLDCDSCCNELYNNSPISNELQAHPGLYGGALKRQTEAEPEGSLFDKIRELFSIKALVPVAIVASLVVMVISMSSDSDVRKLAVVEKMAYVSIDVRSANSAEVADYFENGMQEYQKDNYNSAIELLKQAVDNSENSCKLWDYANLYLGVSFMLTDNPEEAIPCFATVAQSNKLPMVERGDWLMAQANLQLGNKDGAVKILTDLSENSIGYAQKAIDQLELLALELK
jgi:tetratricopeptide (TPR) repeat protein